ATWPWTRRRRRTSPRLASVRTDQRGRGRPGGRPFVSADAADTDTHTPARHGSGPPAAQAPGAAAVVLAALRTGARLLSGGERRALHGGADAGGRPGGADPPWRPVPAPRPVRERPSVRRVLVPVGG